MTTSVICLCPVTVPCGPGGTMVSAVPVGPPPVAGVYPNPVGGPSSRVSTLTVDPTAWQVWWFFNSAALSAILLPQN